MDEYIIKRESIECYLSYLKSIDSKTIIMALQELLFEIEKGRKMTFYEREKIETTLIDIISKNEDSRVRQWCYMLSSFFRSPKLVKICKENLDKEVPKNQTWILALLSHNLNENEFKKIRRQAENLLSKDTINLSTYLFSSFQYEKLDSSYVQKVMSKDDDLAMLWVGWIATFKNQNMRSHQELLVNAEQMSEITRFNNDDVLKHITAAYSRRDNLNINEIKFDIYDYEHMQPEHKKWFLTAIWKDKIFIRKNIDYIKMLLSYNHLFSQCDKRVREGLARGLSTYDFNIDLVQNVLDWMEYERETSVRYFLLIYALKHMEKCRDYQETIYGEMLDGSTTAKKLILSYGNGHGMNINIEEKPSNQTFVLTTGGVTFMRDSYVANQVANQGPGAGENSTTLQFYGSTENSSENCKNLLYEIEMLKQHLKNENESDEKDILIGKLTEAKQSADKNDYSGAVSVIKKLGKELYGISKTIGCALIASIIKEQLPR